MIEYIDHFEIQTQRPGEDWEHVGNVYPKYEWKTYRPWYFLWLVKRQIITNHKITWTTCFKSLILGVVTLLKSNEKVCLVIWLQLGNKLIQLGAIEL